MHRLTLLLLLLLPALVTAAPPELLPGFHRSPWFREQVRERWVEGSIRVLVNAPENFNPKRATWLIVYATPNGNTTERTLGCAKADGLDWQFDIQHIAAQVRKLRELSPSENIVLACVEHEGLSWPAWRRNTPDAGVKIVRTVTALRESLAGALVRVSLAGHSGGGSFLFGFIEANEQIPNWVDRIAFLDANYAFDADKHAAKLLDWLRWSRDRRLVVVAYDDRSITLNGKPVIGKDGGTFRATQRMREAMAKESAWTETKTGLFATCSGADDRLVMYLHPNLENKILHTALVGEMNGLLRVLTDGEPKWGTFGGPRAYTKWVQPAPGIPPRPGDAEGGNAVFKRLATLSPVDREEAIARELLKGNLPDFLRKFQPLTIRGKDKAGREHTAVVEIMTDYLAIGSDTNFVRVPMTPQTAQQIADAFGCSLPTRKLVDEVYQAASVKLAPIPLTERREAVETFLQHNSLIEELRKGQKFGDLTAGTKKDVVITNRLGEKPNRVAIYGWHKTDGTPIQPLTIVHRDSYVDYSHGVRLIRRTITLDGKPIDIRQALHADTAGLLSDEGPVDWPSY